MSEVQFGETSSGAAMVQGTFVGADQAGVRGMGPAFRRVGGSEDREKSIREARGLMQGYAQQLNISDSLVTAERKSLSLHLAPTLSRDARWRVLRPSAFMLLAVLSRLAKSC